MRLQQEENNGGILADGKTLSELERVWREEPDIEQRKLCRQAYQAAARALKASETQPQEPALADLKPAASGQLSQPPVRVMTAEVPKDTRPVQVTVQDVPREVLHLKATVEEVPKELQPAKVTASEPLKTELQWIRWYPLKIFSDRHVCRMNATQLGWYIRLYARAYESGGSLPNDPEELHSLAVAECSLEEFTTHSTATLKPFDVVGETLVHRELTQIIEDSITNFRRSQQNGHRGGIASAEARRSKELVK